MIAGLKSNRCLNGQKVSQWHQQLRHKRYERVTVPAADGATKTYFVRTLQGRLNEVPFDVRVFISKRHPRSKAPAYFLCTDLSLTAQAGLVRYGDRWPTEVDNFYLKTRLDIADYQLQAFEEIENQTGQPLTLDHPKTLADVIRLHRAEHDIQLLQAAAQLALQCGSIAPVLRKFVRPCSTLTSPAEIAL